MKKILVILTICFMLLIPFNLTAQNLDKSGSFNIGYSINNFLKIGAKYYNNKMIFGIDGGINCKTPFIGKDYSNIIGKNTFEDDIYENVKYDSFSLNALVGYTFYKGLYLSLLIGYGMNEEGFNCYDKSQILASNGYYSFRTEKSGKFNYGILIGYRYKKIDIGIGYDVIENGFITIGIAF